MEGRLGVHAVGARIGERPDEPQELDREGEPCVRINGIASGSGERTYITWIG